MEKNRRIHKKG